MRANADSIPTRQSLLERLKSADDSQSWQDFFNTYWSLLYTTAVRSGLNDAEAQDVVQETIICVARSMPKFQYDPKIGSFKAWLRKLTRWRIIDQVRRRDAQPTVSINSEEDLSFLNRLPDDGDAPFEVLWEDEWKKAILDAAASKTKTQVHEKQYQIFDLVTLRGQSPTRVAAMLRISEGHVYVSNHRVAKIFKKELKAIDLEAEL